MTQIVVDYEVGGGYDCSSYRAVMCVSYEGTVEEFYVELCDKIKTRSEEMLASIEAWNKYYGGMPNTYSIHNPKEKEKAQKKVEDYIKNTPRPINVESQFEFAGIKWDIDDFDSRSGSIYYPEVFELQDWFNRKKEN